MKNFLTGLGFTLVSLSTFAQSPYEQVMTQHLNQYGKLEHFSGIQVSIKAGNTYQHFAVGTRSFDAQSPTLTTQDLFDIGSITKSFTASLAVIAEREQQLHLSDNVGQHFDNYPHWNDISLTGLLNMSTGIPNYSESPTINYLFSQNLKKFWEPTDLIALTYPKDNDPPRKPGYFYSNTGYVLMDMILTRLYKEPYAKLLQERILTPLHLNHTYYPVPDYPQNLLSQMAHGYSYNIYDNPELLGRDVTENNLSWAGAAGALVSNTADVLQWVEALFINDKLLSLKEKETMQQLISTTDAKPLAQTSKDNPRGFGLGIVQMYDEKIGQFWFYQGETLGYRALYLYVPCNQVIVVAFLNSATNDGNDQGGKLLQTLYQEVLSQNKQLVCAATSQTKM